MRITITVADELKDALDYQRLKNGRSAGFVLREAMLQADFFPLPFPKRTELAKLRKSSRK